MRKTLVLGVVLAVACTTTPDAAPDASTTTSSTSITTTTFPPTTTTSSTSITTTTLPPTTTTLAELSGLRYEEIARFDFPIHMVPRNASLSLLATKDGQIFEYDGETFREVLDINQNVLNRGERGLLAIAVHPRNDSRLFVHYTANDGDTVLEEYRILPDGTVDPEPSWELLRVDQPAGNHNGGMIQWGNSQVLYLGLGDGGGANDRFGHGQNTGSLLGGIVSLSAGIAIDTLGPPPTELHQYGLRNPWRFWIDGDLIYIADVGQNRHEEVSVSSLDSDVNYGWPVTEGSHCFRPSSGCSLEGLTLPVVDVAHGDAGTCSITGGVVYRGNAIPELNGHYFYSDFCGGYLRSFVYQDGVAIEQTDWTEQVGVPGSVVSFGTDHLGEMYVLTTSRILKVTPVRSG